MDLTNAMLNDIFPIVTKLKPEVWDCALEDAGIWEEYKDIPAGLQEGFCCGLEIFSLSCTSILPNYYTSEEEEFIIAKYAEEIKLGRLSHGYDPDTLFSLIGHF